MNGFGEDSKISIDFENEDAGFEKDQREYRYKNSQSKNKRNKGNSSSGKDDFLSHDSAQLSGASLGTNYSIPSTPAYLINHPSGASSREDIEDVLQWDISYAIKFKGKRLEEAKQLLSLNLARKYYNGIFPMQ